MVSILSLPSMLLRLQPMQDRLQPTLLLQPTGRSCVLYPTAVGAKMERWRGHPRRWASTTQLRQGMSWRPLCLGRSDGPVESDPIPLSHPLSDMIRDFYSSINEKDMGKLEKFIADSCVFEDLAFQGNVIRYINSYPYYCLNEVRRFLKELMEAMGKHVQFSIEGVYESGGTHVGVLWHLEWNKETIPFTKSCSFFECSKNGEKLCIKRARMFVESPVKPGEIVLELLKIISTLFDKFPKLAEKFLRRPGMMIQFAKKTYNIFVEPFIFPLLVYYIYLWTFAARIESYMLIIPQNLLKFIR